MYAIQDVASGDFVDMGGEFAGMASEPRYATLWEDREVPDMLLYDVEDLLSITGQVVELNVCEFTGDVCEYGECEDWCRYEHEERVFGKEVD